MDYAIEHFFAKKGFRQLSRDVLESKATLFLFQRGDSEEGVLVIYSSKQLNFYYMPIISDVSLKSWWIADVAASASVFTSNVAERLLRDVLKRGRELQKGPVSWEA
jgi:hypothetical protein